MSAPRPIPPPLTAAWWFYELRFGLMFCLLISVVVTLLWGKPFSINLTYSYAIGLLTQALIEIGRYGLSAWVRRRRPDDESARRHWPGWPLMGTWMLVSVVLGYAGGTAIGNLIIGGPPGMVLLNDPRHTIGAILAVTLMAAFAATMHLYLQHRWAADALARTTAERAATEARLKLLEAQLDPHMMFNTLANLRALIDTDPPRAGLMVDQLNRFLRATLSASRAPLHPLASEYDRLRDYLALMQTRMGARLRVELELPEALRAQPVPPLLLQPLVENAIRHGLEPQPGGGTIRLSAALDGPQVRLVVSDNGVGWPQAPAAAPGATPGVGLQLVRERLATLYGPRASLSITAGPTGGTEVTLRLPAGAPATTDIAAP